LDNFHISDKKNSPVLGKSTVMVVCLRERSRCRRKRPRLQPDKLTTADYKPGSFVSAFFLA